MNSLLKMSVFSLVFAFLMTIGIGNFEVSHAWEKKVDPTQSKVKARGKQTKQNAVTRWNSLSPEQQQYMEEKAKQHASDAKMTGQQYWDSLSPEEQQEAIERSRARAEKGRKRWKSLPE